MNINDLLASMIRLAIPTVLVTLGGIFSYRINLFPIALEGLLLGGCFAVVAGTYVFQNCYIGILFAMLVVMIINLLYAALVFELHANETVSGFALTIIVSGLSRFLLGALFDSNGKMVLDGSLAIGKINMPFLADIPILGPLLNGHSIIVYVSLVLVFVVWFVLYKTKFGLELRAVGQNEEAATYVNIKTKRTKYIAMALCGLLCGLGGAQLALASNLFTTGMSNGRGYTAIAAIVLSGAEPFYAFLICLIYGLCNAVVVVLSNRGYVVQFLSMLPYVVAILIAVLPSAVRYVRKRLQAQKYAKDVEQHRIVVDDGAHDYYS